MVLAVLRLAGLVVLRGGAGGQIVGGVFGVRADQPGGRVTQAAGSPSSARVGSVCGPVQTTLNPSIPTRSTGKLLSNMHRSRPNVSIHHSSVGTNISASCDALGRCGSRCRPRIKSMC